MSNPDLTPLSPEELAAEGGTALPDKEVICLLDLNADLDLALDAAAPIDLAVAANANVAAPIDAAVGANVLSVGSTAQALADQGVIIDQGINGEATAAPQDSTIDQGDDTVGTEPSRSAHRPGCRHRRPDVGAVPTDTGGDALDGNLLNVDVDLAADLDLAAPIAGAVAANANVAAPDRRRGRGQHRVGRLRGDRRRPAGRDHHPGHRRRRDRERRPGLRDQAVARARRDDRLRCPWPVGTR